MLPHKTYAKVEAVDRAILVGELNSEYCVRVEAMTCVDLIDLARVALPHRKAIFSYPFST